MLVVSIYRLLCMELPGWNHHLHDSCLLIAHCQMLHIAIVVVVEALGLFLKIKTQSLNTSV